MKNNQRNTCKEDNKYTGIIEKSAEDARKKGLIDLDFLDQIPDDDTSDSAIPFPYGSSFRRSSTWNV